MNDLTVKEENAVGLAVNELQGAEAAIDNDDILIPKLHLMQAMSKLVQDDKAKKGEYRNSVTEELVTEKGKPFDVIVFDAYKVLHEYRQPKGGKKEFAEVLDYSKDDDWGFEVKVLADGTEVSRQAVMGFYCVNVAEVKEGAAFPYVLDFRSTSYKTGKVLSTNFAKLRMMNKKSWDKVFSVSAEEVENEHGKFFVKKVSTGRDTTEEERMAVIEWLQILRNAKAQGKVREDNSDVEEDVVETTAETKF